MQLYATKNIHLLYIISFMHSLLKWLQEFPTWKQILSLKVGPKCITRYYNQGHIIQELRTREGSLTSSIAGRRGIFLGIEPQSIQHWNGGTDVPSSTA